MQVSDPANAAPKFPDQDLNTAWVTSRTRRYAEVEENTKKGVNIGEPVIATDDDVADLQSWRA